MGKGSLVWFRRDLRLQDNATLHAAICRGGPLYACFVFDPALLKDLPADDRRVAFIRDALAELQRAWRLGGDAAARIVFLYGDPLREVPALAAALDVDAVFAGRDFEPSAKDRDAAVAARLAALGKRLQLVKDQVVFASEEIRTREGGAFSVYTPYRRRWRECLRDEALRAAASERFARAATPPVTGELPCLADGGPDLTVIGFASAGRAPLPAGRSGALRTWSAFAEGLDAYHDRRDFPALDATSRLSAHLRFGTVSVRELVAAAWQRERASGGEGARTWLDELIWREFFMSVLDAHPHVVTGCFRPQYDALCWDDAPELFDAWCAGRTGYPFVDAAMRQLVATGFMHNRARMVVASFLSKDLGIDWRLGEAFFARQLLDYELSSNNGGWQWSASTGCDAQPYFRIFNPLTQSKKFDPAGDYIRRWVPELRELSAAAVHAPGLLAPGCDYPLPAVDHAVARARTLARFAAVRR